MDARQFAADFLENLISFFGINVLVESSVDEDEGVILLDVPSTHMNGFLIGQDGENLRAMQNLVNSALRCSGYEEAHVNVDIAGYKRQRNQRLERDVQQRIETVQQSGEDYELQPMNAYDRRIAHRVVGEAKGVESESTGQGKDRKVVIRKSQSQDSGNSEDTTTSEPADED